MIRWKQAVDGFPDFGMTFGNPDFVAYAKAYGAEGQPGGERGWPGADARSGLCRRRRPSRRRAGRLFGEHPGPGRRTARPCREGRRAGMIEVVQAFDRAPIAQLDSDDAAALDRKIEAAAKAVRRPQRVAQAPSADRDPSQARRADGGQARASRSPDRARGRQAADRRADRNRPRHRRRAQRGRRAAGRWPGGKSRWD